MKLSEILNELDKGNSVKFSLKNKPKYQVQKKEKYELIKFSYFGNREIYSLKKAIYTLSRFVKIDKKGLKLLKFSKDEIEEIKKYSEYKDKYDIKVFKRPIRKSAGAKPINDILETYLTENKYSFLPEFRTYRIRIRSIADYISIENNNVVVYEVKSDVDSFLRLEKQVKDYLTYADKVYIVLHEKKFKSFLKDYSHLLEKCGLIIFSDKGLSFENEAPINKPKQKIKLLLSKEELSIMKQFKGYTKITSKIKFFKKVFDDEKKNEIISNVLSSRFEKRRTKDYTEGILSLDLSDYQDKATEFISKHEE